MGIHCLLRIFFGRSLDQEYACEKLKIASTANHYNPTKKAKKKEFKTVLLKITSGSHLRHHQCFLRFQWS